MNEENMSEEFKILSPRDHVRLRTGMYLGAVSNETIERFIKGKWLKTSYVPAIFKMINEILDNSIDEAIRTNFKYANKIEVSIENDYITIKDNGRGIPQELITDLSSGEKIQRPVAAWTKTNAGTSFSDDRVSIGANGVGSAATNFLSKEFIGETWQNGTVLIVNCSDGAENISVTTKKRSGNGTSVKFIPDFSFFECDHLDESNIIDLVEDRLMAMQLAFPEINFYFNNDKIKINDIKKYGELFVEDGASIIIEKNDDLSFFISASNDGFRTNSYINGVNTYLGGTYVDYIINGIVDELLVMIKKKYKIDVTKSIIKSGLTFVLFAKNFVNPKFDSQTKERLTSGIAAVKQHYSNSCNKDFKIIAKKLFSADDIIQPLIAAQIAKKEADEHRDALVAQKKIKKIKVAKHIAASSDQAILCLVEGDSAASSLIETRDPKKIGGFPLRGVIMNTWDKIPSEVLKNKELSELVAILDLNINDKDSYKNMSYAKLGILTDADYDGGHIATLIIAFVKKFWPGMIKDKRLVMFKSPVQISKKGKDVRWFYDYEDGENFKNSSTGYDHRHIKGLGSLTKEEYSIVINTPYLKTITENDAQEEEEKLYDIMFGNDADLRKEYMMK
jgi:DNA topoisomerase-2